MRSFLIFLNQYGGCMELLAKEDWEGLAQQEDICRTKKGQFKGRKNDVSIFEERVIGQETKTMVCPPEDGWSGHKRSSLVLKDRKVAKKKEKKFSKISKEGGGWET